MRGLRGLRLIDDDRHLCVNMITVIYLVKGRATEGREGLDAGEPEEGGGEPRADRGNRFAVVS
jgi:hypothetical protein